MRTIYSFTELKKNTILTHKYSTLSLLKYSLGILLVSCTASQQVTFIPSNDLQTTYKIQWNTVNESIFNKGGYFKIESASDTSKKWDSIGKVNPGLFTYSYAIPATPLWFRVKAMGVASFTAGPVLLTVSDNATITNLVYKTTSLNWNVSNASNVLNYLIERTPDNRAYSTVKTVPDKGNGLYFLTITKTVRKYTYTITVIFKDGAKTQRINFK